MVRISSLVLAIAVSGSAAGAAVAHAKLVTATPAANAAANAPASIKLKFNEPVVAQFSGITLQMTDMPGMKMSTPSEIAVGASKLAADRTTLSAKLAKPLATGTYRVLWHAVTADTHRVEGSYSFTVK